jgi:formylglycine-generating enzyme required for sulfatase activity
LQQKEQKRLAELTALKQKLLDQATANEVDEAMSSLRELRANLPADDPFPGAAAAKAIADAYVRLAGIAARDGRFDTAVTLIDRAGEIDRTHPQLAALREKYAQSLAAAQTSSAAKKEAAPVIASGSPSVSPSAPPPTAPSAATTTQAAPVTVAPTREGAVSAASTVPTTSTPATSAALCNATLAGYGTRSRGVCFDTLASGRGPELVVIPAGGSVARPFAISRYEVSVGEYNAFCQQSDQCRSLGAQADLPVTSIAVADAQHYAEWLSAATGFVYRLPTDSEWLYAADAPGGSTERNFNCVVEIGGQKIRGFALVSVRSGRPNGWGLYNYIGNAQEWVKAADGWSTRGGAYSDAISQCGTALVRAGAGAADAATGFRVLRELR